MLKCNINVLSTIYVFYLTAINNYLFSIMVPNNHFLCIYFAQHFMGFLYGKNLKNANGNA